MALIAAVRRVREELDDREREVVWWRENVRCELGGSYVSNWYLCSRMPDAISIHSEDHSPSLLQTSLNNQTRRHMRAVYASRGYSGLRLCAVHICPRARRKIHVMAVREFGRLPTSRPDV